MITTVEEAPAQTHLLARHHESVRAARRWSAATLSAWGLGGLIDDATIVVSELTTNAIEHTSGSWGPKGVNLSRLRLDLVLLADGLLRIAMHDYYDCSLGVPVVPDDTDEHGRGLFIVANLAQTWGVDPTDTGKVVWCTLSACPRHG